MVEEKIDPLCLTLMDNIVCKSTDYTIVVQIKIPGDAPGEYEDVYSL